MFGFEIAEDVPVAAEDLLKEEANATVADAQSRGGPLVDVSAVEEVLLELLFGNEVGGLLVELHQHEHRAGV